ncbi:helix-turn-helix domain-containing protein [Porcipelethomonas sp.]|uniref:helix-turn-helix domain-containing protein n=1 Tax=Porcipelethomonas sp. TaxID=2981675 RepID=UPI003EF37FE0
MTEEELIYLSRQFANMFGMPVRLYKNTEQIYYFSTVNLPADPVLLCLDNIMNEHHEVSYYVDDNFFYYGIVNHNNYKFVAGPVSELKKSESELKKLAFMLKLSGNEIPLFVSEMMSLSGIHLDSVIQSVILYNFSVNRTRYDISDIRIRNAEQKNISSEIKESEFVSQKDEDSHLNNARAFSIEKDIIKKIMNGDVEGLIDGASKIPAVSSGNLALHLIRHQKNFFIKLETIASRAAIEAGLDIDEAVAAEEMYIIKCESLENIDRIKNLQYHMLLDYADRVKKHHQYNKNNSKLVNDISKYIYNHISEPIKTSDIAEYLGKSRGSVTTEFKKQTGTNLSDFINMKKVQEAEELLYETDRSLASISDFLGFSSQSHFCKVFKKITGVTPTEYRSKKF